MAFTMERAARERNSFTEGITLGSNCRTRQ